MVSLLSGLLGGFVATIVMTAVMMTMGDDSPPPTAVLWAKYVGGGSPDQYMMPGMVLHFIYGITMGGVFVIGAAIFGLSLATLGSAILWALVWGMILFVIGAGFWMMVVLDMEPDMSMAAMFFMMHLVYGVALGIWVAYTPFT